MLCNRPVSLLRGTGLGAVVRLDSKFIGRHSCVFYQIVRR
jgi:hypothetical protein